MKFSKEEAFEKLKGALTNEGKKPLRMTERSLKTQIESLLPKVATDETELDDFVKDWLPVFETMNSNAEYDNSVNYKKIKKELEDKFDGKKDEEPKSKEDGSSELEKRIALLEAELEKNKREKGISAIKSRISDGLKSKGVSDSEWVSAIMNEISISEDTDVDTKVESILNLYNKSRAAIDPNTTPGSSSYSSKRKDEFMDNFMSDFKKEREAQIEKEKGLI